MTRAIVDIASPLVISVHDHIIVGKNGHASLKRLRLWRWSPDLSCPVSGRRKQWPCRRSTWPLSSCWGSVSCSLSNHSRQFSSGGSSLLDYANVTWPGTASWPSRSKSL